jgi:kinesin family protein 11
VICFADMSVQERGSISGMLNVVKTHVDTLETFREDHSGLTTSIEEKSRETFQQMYRVGFFHSIFCLMFRR